jgi:peptidoglycan/xylan/chitin deacetylase (PgdA/CDA1 family)
MRRALVLAAVLAFVPTGAAAAPATAKQAVPILMYHVIDSPPAGAPFPSLYVSRSDFAGQVRWLAAHGFHAVSLEQLYAAWERGGPLPSKPVVLTFDDGYLPDITAALPILRAHGWPGVLFLHIGNLAPFRVRVLQHGGWEIDAHTFTHPDLTTVDAARLRREIAGSRKWIQGVFHVPCDFFAYPSGRYDAAAVAEVRAAGYSAAVTTNYGLSSPKQGLYTLDRIRVNGGDGVAGLAAKLG